MIVIARNYQEKFQAWSFSDFWGRTGTIKKAKDNRRALRFFHDGEAFFLKAHEGVGFKEVMKNLCHGRLPIVSAKNEWRALNRLLQLSIPSITPVAYGTSGFLPTSQRSFLVTKDLGAIVDLDTALQQRPFHNHSWSEKKSLIRQVATITRRLHEQGMNHRDLYLCHFVFDEKNQVRLIDLHRAGIRNRLPARWRVKDLGSLYFSVMPHQLGRKWHYYFLQCYFGMPLRELLDTNHSLLSQVERKAQALYQKAIRKGIITHA